MPIPFTARSHLTNEYAQRDGLTRVLGHLTVVQVLEGMWGLLQQQASAFKYQAGGNFIERSVGRDFGRALWFSMPVVMSRKSMDELRQLPGKWALEKDIMGHNHEAFGRLLENGTDVFNMPDHDDMARAVARKAIRVSGMSDHCAAAGVADGFETHVSETTMAKIEEAEETMLRDMRNQAIAWLSQHQHTLEAFARHLMEQRELDGEEAVAWMDQNMPAGEQEAFRAVGLDLGQAAKAWMGASDGEMAARSPD